MKLIPSKVNVLEWIWPVCSVLFGWDFLPKYVVLCTYVSKACGRSFWYAIFLLLSPSQLSKGDVWNKMSVSAWHEIIQQQLHASLLCCPPAQIWRLSNLILARFFLLHKKQQSFRYKFNLQSQHAILQVHIEIGNCNIIPRKKVWALGSHKFGFEPRQVYKTGCAFLEQRNYGIFKLTTL